MNVSDLLFKINLTNGRYADPLNLTRFDSRVYSQFGQDGWIAKIFNRIGTTNRFFIEIGIEDGTECNSRLLLEQGWTGVWIDGGSKVPRAKENFLTFIVQGNLQIVEQFVTIENVNDILDAAGVPTDIDFLSVDTDMNTSHIWRAINRTARVVDVEYNASLPCSVSLEVPYDPKGVWSGGNFFGASLKTMEHIGLDKNMSLVGCELAGVDAFFVHNDFKDQFQAPFSAEFHREPCRYDLQAGRGHAPDRLARRYIRHEAT